MSQSRPRMGPDPGQEGFGGFAGYLFDLDGCIYCGQEAAPGAVALLTTLGALGRRIAFVSNNSSMDAGQLARKLGSLGIPARPEDILVPTDHIGRFLLDRYGTISIFPLASGILQKTLVQAGHRLADDQDSGCDVVLVARDTEFSYTKLAAASRFLQSGSRLVATNADISHPGDQGYLVPETGALLAAIQAMGSPQARYFGKPEPWLFELAIQRLGLGPEDVVMVGDNLLTDIAGAAAIGIKTVWLNPRGQTCTKAHSPWMTCRSLEDLLASLPHPTVKEPS